MQLVNKILFICVLFLSLNARAEECYFKDGGYCVSQIFNSTRQAIDESKNEKAEQIKQGISKNGYGPLGITLPVNEGTFIYVSYDVLWDWMVTGGAVLAEDKTTAFNEASKAGGTKIAGVNLVVLGARTLQKLVDLQILTLEDAQKILNEAKERGAE
ncbi:hypothetical protein K1X76_12485 [bacterium]|nr:hypothetical protein [bacterium]